MHRYAARSGVVATHIFLPSNLPEDLFISSDGEINRGALWNAAEGAERRKNSCVARELILALPHELDETQRINLAKDMSTWLVERYNVAVDLAVHEPVDAHGHDTRNHHAHLLFSTRELLEHGFGPKTRILDDKATGVEQTELIRQVWETLANDALTNAGFDDIKVDRRSLEDQGIDRIPQTHIGPKGNKASQNAVDHHEDGDDERGEDTRQGSGEKSSSSSSGGGAAAVQTKGGNEDEDSGDEDSGKQGSSDSFALKVTSKLRLDHQHREIDYRVIDRLKTRRNFVEEIKLLNERRAAFGEKPIKDQLIELDRLMDKLDTRFERLQAIEDKTAFPIKIMEMIERVTQKAAELLGLRHNDALKDKLHDTEVKAKEGRQQARYGRVYRRGLHAQIDEMKVNIERLETKRGEVERYAAFVEKLETEIALHTPSIAKQSEVEERPVKKVTNKELSLKLKLKASAMQDIIPDEFKPIQPQKDVNPSQTPDVEVSAYTTMQGVKLKEQSQVFAPEKDIFAPQVKFKQPETARVEVSVREDADRKEQDWKTRNAVPIKAMVREMETHKAVTPLEPQARVRTGKTLQQELRREHSARVEKARAHVPDKFKAPEREVETPKTDKIFIKDLEDVRSRRREDEKGVSLRSKFRTSEKLVRDKPPTMSNEEHSELRRSRTESVRPKIDPKYRASDYAGEDKEKSQSMGSKGLKDKWSGEASDSKAHERPRMSHGFNDRAASDDLNDDPNLSNDEDGFDYDDL